MKTLAVILLAVMPCVSQTRSELQRKYYSDDVQHYEVRPGVVMTVSFTGEDRAREIVIEPRHEQGTENPLVKGMTPAKLTRIINEVVPESGRGRLLNQYNFTTGCTDIQTS